MTDQNGNPLGSASDCGSDIGTLPTSTANLTPLPPSPSESTGGDLSIQAGNIPSNNPNAGTASSNPGLDATQLGLAGLSMIPGPVGTGASLANAGISFYRGNYGQGALDLAFAIPFVGTFGRMGELGEEGFQTFRAFKRVYGTAGEGMQWHHIVEQAGNVDRFGPGALHNIENVVAVPTTVHRKISGFYSSIQEFSNGQTVRMWLRSQSFEAQRDFGLQTLRRYNLIP